MKAVVVSHSGGLEVLEVKNVPTPDVRSSWSLVKVKGFGINHSEIFTRRGLSPSVKFPRILGIECVGIISKTTDPENLPEGARIVSIMGKMGRAFDGSYAEYCLLPNKQIIPVDTDLPWDVLAAIPETFYTAYGSLENLHLPEQGHILVRGATSGVGMAFAKLVSAAYPHMKLTGSCRHPETKKGPLFQAGFHNVIADTDNHLQTDLIFDRALDLIGPAALKDTCAHMAPGSIVCSTGQLGGKWFMDDFDPIENLPANGYLTSFYSGNVTADRMRRMINFITAHHIDAAPERIFDLDHIADAHRYLESSRSLGKVVVLP